MASEKQVEKKKQQPKVNQQKNRKQKFMNLANIILVIICLILSGYNFDSIDKLDGNKEIEATNSIIEFGTLYGTHGCEEGGFSIQSGLDKNHNSILDQEEISEIKNVCHGEEGNPGPMGNRGYWGYNGTDGTNGSTGLNGTSSFIQSETGIIGTCDKAVVIGMGNDSETGKIDSEVKLCIGEMFSGRITDIAPSAGNSFSTGCSNGAILNDSLIFSAQSGGNCMLFSAKDDTVTQISNSSNILPGLNLGFTEFDNKIWFDAYDGQETQLWSTDGLTLTKRSDLGVEITASDSIIHDEERLIIIQNHGITTFGESSSYQSGIFTNISLVNQKLIYNANSGIEIDGVNIGGEIHSEAIFLEGRYYFLATSDSHGIELHSSNGLDLLRLSQISGAISANDIMPISNSDTIFFSAGELYSYNIENETSYLVSDDFQVAKSDVVVLNDRIWFSCHSPFYGIELCNANSQNVTLIDDFVSGFASSNPKMMTVLDGEIFAILDDSQGGGVLCHITENLVEEVFDHSTGNLQSGTDGEIWFGPNLLYFVADTTTHGTELFGWSYGITTEEWILI